MSTQVIAISPNASASEASKVDLTICVIGHNEASNLSDCAASLEHLKSCGIACETLFVDSASSDNSANIAAELFDSVVELQASSLLNAGAARAAGTIESQGRWILYLDGDMRLRPEFHEELLSTVLGAQGIHGLAGQTKNIYPDGSSDLMKLTGNLPGLPCKAFGGAVLLQRQQVMDAGNWAANLFSNEEAELYSRLLMRDSTVIWTPTHMVDHITPKFTATNKLRGSMFPWNSHLGKKFFGAGQATRRAWMEGNLFSFARLKPFQFSMIAALGLSILTLIFSPKLAAWPLLCTFIGISIKRGPKFAINCVCWTSQTIFGWTKLDANYWPTIQRTRKLNRSRPPESP